MNTAVQSPFFSIIIPTYNRAHLIMDTIKSIQSQSYTNWELIVVDDGSTDETAELFEKIKDERIKCHFKKNEERNIARNFGFSKSVGKYILFFDSDDRMLPDNLQHFHDILEHNPELPIVSGGYRFKTVEYAFVKQKHLHQQDKLSAICETNWLPIMCSFIKRDIVKLPLFHPDPKFILSEDLYIWLKLLTAYDVYLSDHIAVEIIEHEGRSMNDWSYAKHAYATKTILRESKQYLTRRQWNLLSGTHHSMTALAAAKTGTLRKAIHHYIIALKSNPSLITHRRLPAVFKNLFLRMTR